MTQEHGGTEWYEKEAKQAQAEDDTFTVRKSVELETHLGEVYEAQRGDPEAEHIAGPVKRFLRKLGIIS